MAQKKTDMASLLRQAADTRKNEQSSTVEAIKTGTGAVQRGRKPRYTDADPKMTVTFTMTASRKEKLRQYAFEQRKTISDIIGEFVDGL